MRQLTASWHAAGSRPAGTNGRVAQRNAPAMTAGHTACRTASITGTPTRRHAAGKSTNAAAQTTPRHEVEVMVFVSPERGIDGSAHFAPFPNRITLTVSKMMVRSKKID